MCSCYRNKAKEESRQGKLEAFRETGVWPGMKSKVESKIAWSEKQDRKKKKLERIRKKDLKRANEEEVDNDEKEADDDEDDLEADYRLLKKIKRVSFSVAVISTCLISFHLFFFCRKNPKRLKRISIVKLI